MQDHIIAALTNLALTQQEAGNEFVAEAVRDEATRLAKRYGLSKVPGLPKTFGDANAAH